MGHRLHGPFVFFIYSTSQATATDSFSFHSISGRDKVTKPFMKIKNALDGLLNPETQQKDVHEDSGSDDDDDQPKTQASDGGALETDKKAGDEATPAQLAKEKELVDARQTLNKEKARAELEKKEQKKASAAALKEIRDEEKKAEKAAQQESQASARASGLYKRARK